jgi:hypothetical protein
MIEQNIIALVVAMTLYHENCHPISERDRKAIADISKALDPTELKKNYDFFAALRAQNGDARFCEVVQDLYGNILLDEP